jgi:hypothetical protein
MLTALIVIVIVTSALVLALLAVVVAGIRREPPSAELSSRAPSLMAGLARRMVGVYVRRPDPSADADRPDTCLAGHAAGHGDEGEPR